MSANWVQFYWCYKNYINRIINRPYKNWSSFQRLVKQRYFNEYLNMCVWFSSSVAYHDKGEKANIQWLRICLYTWYAPLLKFINIFCDSVKAQSPMLQYWDLVGLPFKVHYEGLLSRIDTMVCDLQSQHNKNPDSPPWTNNLLIQDRMFNLLHLSI